MRVALGVLVMCLLLASTWTEAQTEENDPYEPADCIATWDPFCPNEPGSGPGPGDPEDCYVCETGLWPDIGNARICMRAGAGMTGRSVCDDGWLFAYCDLSGAFCEIVSVSP